MVVVVVLSTYLNLVLYMVILNTVQLLFFLNTIESEVRPTKENRNRGSLLFYLLRGFDSLTLTFIQFEFFI